MDYIADHDTEGETGVPTSPLDPSALVSNRSFDSNPEFIQMALERKEGRDGQGYDPALVDSTFPRKYDLSPGQHLNLVSRTSKRAKTHASKSSLGEMYRPIINQRSRTIVEKSQRQGTVHERLFAYHRKRRSEVRSLTLSPQSISRSYSSLNIGNSLYLKGIQMKERVRREAQLYHEEEAQQRKHFFKPTVDKRSLMLPRFNSSIEESLLNWGSSIEEKHSNLKTSRSQEELDECSFTPRLNDLSIKIDQRKSLGKQPRFLELYRLATEQKEQQKKVEAAVLKAECPFHPKIWVEKKVAETHDQFISRLLSSRNGPECPTTERKHRKNTYSVGQAPLPQFHPVVNPGSTPRYPSSMSIHEHLYSLREKSPVLPKSDETHQQSALKDNFASEAAFLRFQDTCLKGLFRLLDEDRDGLISIDKMPASVLSEKQKIVLKPVFAELEESEEGWSFPTFKNRVERLIAGLNVEDRGYLLTRAKYLKIADVHVT